MKKIKIKKVEVVANNLQVTTLDKQGNRECFGFPLELAENDVYIDKLKEIYAKRRKAKKKVSINKKKIGKEINV